MAASTAHDSALNADQRLSNCQLKTVMATAAQLAVEKRDPFLQRLAAALSRIRRPSDSDIERAARAALRGLVQEPAA
jgi:hypothetical protein